MRGLPNCVPEYYREQEEREQREYEERCRVEEMYLDSPECTGNCDFCIQKCGPPDDCETDTEEQDNSGECENNEDEYPF